MRPGIQYLADEAELAAGAELADDIEMDALRQARVDAALQAGWVIRHDPLRGEFTAAREMHVGRTLDDLLEKIESA
jgi:hypothetical protein